MASYSDTHKTAGENIKNILSEEQLREMEKNGTVPPNEEFFTPEDDLDENYNYLRTEILWENNAPLADFPAQNISLKSDNYDYLVILAIHNVAAQNMSVTAILPKDKKGARLMSGDCSSNSDYFKMLQVRDINLTDSKTLAVSACRYAYGENTYTTSRNDLLVPYQVIGIVKNPSIIYTGKELYEGTGIKIENGTISSKLYAHCVNLISTNVRVWTTVHTRSNTPFTKDSFHKWLHNAGFNGAADTVTRYLNVSGGYRSSETTVVGLSSGNRTTGDFQMIHVVSKGTTSIDFQVTDFNDIVYEIL